MLGGFDLWLYIHLSCRHQYVLSPKQTSKNFSIYLTISSKQLRALLWFCLKKKLQLSIEIHYQNCLATEWDVANRRKSSSRIHKTWLMWRRQLDGRIERVFTYLAKLGVNYLHNIWYLADFKDSNHGPWLWTEVVSPNSNGFLLFLWNDDGSSGIVGTTTHISHIFN